MFVASVLNEWLRQLGELGKDDRDCDKSKGSTYDDFLRRQKDVWSPSNLYEKCCPRFLAGGVARRSKGGQYVCCGGCQKLHPVVTLYFDAHKNCTVATLSYRLDPFTNYFNQCVKEGRGVWKSPLYCELKGFLRENLHRLWHHQRYFGGHLVKTAIGALEASDKAQKSRLEEAHLRRALRRHGNTFKTEFGTTNAETKPGSYQDFNKLEMVLEICRLWGLEANLDVLSIDCMLRTSHVFRKVAIPMAQKRLRECKLVVTPLVDGHVKSGYSVFRRADTNREKIVERESGRLVEYAVCSSILCLQKEDRKEDTASANCTPVNFLPATCPNTNLNENSERNHDVSAVDEFNEFSWACEELSYTNLELEFMDICLPEYVGQKVVVHWQRSNNDIPDTLEGSDPSLQDSHSSSLIPMLPVVRLRLDWATQKTGVMRFSIPHFDLNLDVERTSVQQVDEVTFVYKGKAALLECRTDFAFLVAAYANSLKPLLIAKHQQIETKRPLLLHEEAFLQEVKKAASSFSLLPHTMFKINV